MKLATRLERDLGRLFLAASVTVAIFVAMGFYAVTVQTQEAASQFISSHVKSLVAAGINSQSVGDIDREIRRLYFAWMSAQGSYQRSDIRIAATIDGVLVGKAGPLKPFGWLSRQHFETERLPSGQTMILKTETDFLPFIKSVGFSLLVVSGCFYVGFLFLRRLLARNIRSLTSPLEARMEWLAEVSLELPDSVRDAVLPQDSDVDEVAALDRSLNAFVRQILRLEARVKEAGIKEGRVEVADRVAHALKGKLAVLRLRIENASGLSAEERQRFRESMNGLMMSSKDMLESGRGAKAESPVAEKAVSTLVRRAVESRREVERLLNRPERIFVSVVGDSQNDIFVDSNSTTGFEDALIAILDNALEASPDGIVVRCDLTTEVVRIEVTDHGCGIPANILPRLMQERATFGKYDGNGLGLFHAANAVKSIGGTIVIRSEENVGTTVSIAISRFFKENLVPAKTKTKSVRLLGPDKIKQDKINQAKTVFETAN